MNQSDHIVRNTTIGGMLLSIAPVVSSGEILKTIILAAVGGTVSFIISLILKWLVSNRSKNRR